MSKKSSDLPRYVLDEARAALIRRQSQREAGVRGEGPPHTMEMKMFVHCTKCVREVQALAERDGSASPRDYARLSVGWTPIGLQVWCVRHNCNVLHVDFEGHTHAANSTAPKDTVQ